MLIKSEKGFTLVELMIVVAIIGLLSAVAIPNFKKYQAKSKTAEAKLQLAAIYTAMQSWYSQYDNYASCLYSMGYDPSREFASRYFATGFEKGTYPINSASVNNGATPDCTDDTTSIDDAYEPPSPSAFGAGKQISGFNAGRDWFITTHLGFTTDVNSGDFLAAAAGPIDPDFASPDTMSVWTINQNKRLRMERMGY